tara:strand:+ start:501 stop:752 length:252 start_codon:yes stop_codon:yes gene_type:complete
MEQAFCHPIGEMSIEEAQETLAKIRGARVDAVRIAQAEGRKHTSKKQIAAKVGFASFKTELEQKMGRTFTDAEFQELMKKALK